MDCFFFTSDLEQRALDSCILNLACCVEVGIACFSGHRQKVSRQPVRLATSEYGVHRKTQQTLLGF